VDPWMASFSFIDSSGVSAIACDNLWRSRVDACREPRRGGGDKDIISGEPGNTSGSGSGLGARKMGVGSGSGKYKKLGSEVMGSAMGVEGCETQESAFVMGGVADLRF